MSNLFSHVSNLYFELHSLMVSIYMLLTGKFGAVLASIPLPIFAALYCVLFAYVGMYFFIYHYQEFEWKCYTSIPVLSMVLNL